LIARIAVERHPHAARVDQLDTTRAAAAKRQVRVAEHEPALGDAAEQLLILLGPGSLWGERAHVGDR
jgi:hypothetical protein